MNKDIYKNLPVFHFADEIKKRLGKKRGLRCLIIGNFGAKNLGDEAILAGQLTELRKIPGIQVTVVARYPEEVVRMHKVQAVSMFAFARIVKTVQASDFVIAGGGGLICKAERGIIGLLFQLYLLSLPFLLPWVFQKKIYVLGMGVYDNTHSLVLPLVPRLLSSAEIITVRDKHSYTLLKKMKLPAEFYKDNSFLMQTLPLRGIAREPYFRRHFKFDQTNIGLALIKPGSEAEEKWLINELCEFIGKNSTAHFWLFSCDTHPSYENDLEFGKNLHIEAEERLGISVNMHVVPASWHPAKFFSSFQLMDFMVAMRMHAQIFAYRQGIPFAGICYDKKGESFLKTIGKQPLSVREYTADRLEKQFLASRRRQKPTSKPQTLPERNVQDSRDVSVL